MTNTTKEMMAKVWGNDWDKVTLSNRIKSIDWADIIAYSVIVLASISLVASILVLVL